MKPSIITDYRAAGYPVVAINTAEESRCVREILESVTGDAEHVLYISATGEMQDMATGSAVGQGRIQYPGAFAHVAQTENAVLIAVDFQHQARNPMAYRPLLDAIPAVKANGSMIVLIAPDWNDSNLAAELKHSVKVLDHDLPDDEALHVAVETIANAVDVELDDDTADAFARASRGMTLDEAENAIAKAALEGLDDGDAAMIDIIEREKMQALKASGALELWDPVSPESIGGLGRYKEYLENEVVESLLDDDLKVRGILIVGLPGGGKSLSAKALGAQLGRQVVKFDPGACKDKHVGGSEGNLRRALKIVEAVAPCVLWIDEIEKAVGGAASSAESDGGTTLGMVGILLTWLQEHESDIVTIATCNEYELLPAPLTRAGRFDERFFVDLPTLTERVEIAGIHLSRFCDDSNVVTECAERLAKRSEGWVGAEIEAAVKSAARRSKRKFTTDAIDIAASEIKPISVVRADEIQSLRKWADGTLRMANTECESGPADVAPKRTIRK